MSQLTISTATVLNSLLGADTTAEVVKEIQDRLKKICTPWERDGCTPAGWIRKNGMGRLLGVVDARLGGYGDCHNPHKHGWGYEGKNPGGQGVGLHGLQVVDTGQLVLDEPKNKDAIKECEEIAKLEAMKIVDEFLSREFNLILQERVL